MEDIFLYFYFILYFSNILTLTYLAVGSHLSSKLIVWDVVLENPVAFDRFRGNSTAVSWSPDGLLLAVGMT